MLIANYYTQLTWLFVFFPLFGYIGIICFTKKSEWLIIALMTLLMVVLDRDAIEVLIVLLCIYIATLITIINRKFKSRNPYNLLN